MLRSILIALVFLPQFVWAQTPYLGIWANYTYGYPSSINRALGTVPLFGTNGEGISWDNSFLFSARLDASSLLSEDFGLSFGLGYRNGSGTFKSSQFVFSQTSIPPSSDPVNSLVEFHITSNYQMIDLQSLLTFDGIAGWYAGTGIFTNYRIGSDLVDAIHIVGPPNTQFANGARIDTVVEGESLGSPRFHWGIPGAIGYRGQLFGSLLFGAEFFIRYDLGEAFRGYPGVGLSGGLGLGIMFDIGERIVLPLPEGPAILEPLEPNLLASVQFKVYGVDEDQLTIDIYDTLETRYLELPQWISYPSDREALPELFNRSPATNSFTLTNLDRASIGQCYSQLPDIIGFRLRENASRTLIIVPTAQNSESVRAKTSRGRDLYDYLTESWNIPQKQVRLRRSEKGSPGLLLQDDRKTLSPLVSTWQERSYGIPDISVDKYISAPERGAENWRIRITQGSKQIVSYGKTDAAGTREMLALPVSSIGNDNEPLIAQLQVQSGGIDHYFYDTLNVSLRNSGQSTVPTKRQTYILSSDSLANPKSWSTFLFDRSLSSLGASSIVHIEPLSERSGASLVASRLLGQIEKRTLRTKQVLVVPSKTSQESDYGKQMLAGVVKITIIEDSE